MLSPPRRALVIDDEPSIAATLQELLIGLGYAVQLAETASAGLGLVGDFGPDVVLLDLGLPDTPGELVLERLRAVDPLLPVIMVTGNQDPELARRTLARGAFDYVAKPFNLQRLEQVLEAAWAFRT
jgi:DNA-binding response OmpR family regulator